MKYINPFYIELQETIVGKYLNIVHTYIHEQLVSGEYIYLSEIV